MSLTLSQILPQTATYQAPPANRAQSAELLYDEMPAATFEPSGLSGSDSVFSDQQRALKDFRFGAASEEGSVALNAHSKTPVGQPNNWRHLKQDLVKYLDGAQKSKPWQKFNVPSKGFSHLDRSGDPLDATGAISEYRAPGCVTVSMHGIAPVDRKSGQVNPHRNAAPFWNGTDPSIWNLRDDGVRSTEEVFEELQPHLDPAEDAPIFLNTCNAGTESEGYVPAAEMAKLSGRYVIAPVDSRILGAARGPQLVDKGGEWRAFHPDGTSELIYKPKEYSNPR